MALAGLIMRGILILFVIIFGIALLSGGLPISVNVNGPGMSQENKEDDDDDNTTVVVRDNDNDEANDSDDEWNEDGDSNGSNNDNDDDSDGDSCCLRGYNQDDRSDNRYYGPYHPRVRQYPDYEGSYRTGPYDEYATGGRYNTSDDWDDDGGNNGDDDGDCGC